MTAAEALTPPIKDTNWMGKALAAKDSGNLKILIVAMGVLEPMTMVAIQRNLVKLPVYYLLRPDIRC